MAASKQERVKTLLDRMHGKACWSAIAGAGTGSHLTLHIGDKMRLAVPLRNPTLTADERLHEGELWLYVEDAAWRLEERSKVVCGSTSPNGIGEEMPRGVKHLVGRRVESCTLSEPAYDLTVCFSGDVVLRVFCDQMDDADNYSVGGHELTALTIGPRGEIG